MSGRPKQLNTNHTADATVHVAFFVDMDVTDRKTHNCPLCILCVVLLSASRFPKAPPDELDAPDDLVPLEVGALVDADDAELTGFPLSVLPNVPETCRL